MSARVKVGLIAGGIGLVLTVCVSAAFGICGPVVSLIAGAIAGYFATKQESPATQGEGGKIGAISGAIAGGLCVIGQIIGGIIALTVLPNLAPQYAGVGGESGYWLGGGAVALCFGAAGTVLAAIAGYAVGYISSNKPVVPPSAPV